MRARDRRNLPTAPHRGVYGCGHCGNYAIFDAGHELACTRCRCARPMVPVSDPIPTEKMPCPPESPVQPADPTT
jgi:hypothetical protein